MVQHPDTLPVTRQSRPEALPVVQHQDSLPVTRQYRPEAMPTAAEEAASEDPAEAGEGDHTEVPPEESAALTNHQTPWW